MSLKPEAIAPLTVCSDWDEITEDKNNRQIEDVYLENELDSIPIYSEDYKWSDMWFEELTNNKKTYKVARKEDFKEKLMGVTAHSEVINSIKFKKNGLYVIVNWPKPATEFLIKDCEVVNEELFGKVGVEYLFEVRRYSKTKERLVIYAVPSRKLTEEEAESLDDELSKLLDGAVD